MRRLVKWFGAEANSRAVTSLLAVGGALGVALVFVWTNVVVPAFPELGAGGYSDGYRAAKRITELELRVQSLEHLLKVMEETEQIREEVENMSEEELNKELAKDAR